MTTNNKCIVCNKDISSGDIFMKIEIDMRRLIYNETEGENDFLVPETAKFYLCDVCSQGLMMSAPKDIAMAIVEGRDRKTHDE